LDFSIDGLASQRLVRILSVVDVFTRECLAMETDTSLGDVPTKRLRQWACLMVLSAQQPRR